MAEKLSIKQVAERFELSEHTIRYYCNLGLIPTERDGNNRRVFNDESLTQLELVKCFRGCGMSIESIKEYQQLAKDGDSTLEQRAEIIHQQQQAIQAQFDEAKRRLDFINYKVKWYEEKMAGHRNDSADSSAAMSDNR